MIQQLHNQKEVDGSHSSNHKKNLNRILQTVRINNCIVAFSVCIAVLNQKVNIFPTLITATSYHSSQIHSQHHKTVKQEYKFFLFHYLEITEFSVNLTYRSIF